jgi:DnaJ-domain-containing protein 1
MSEALRRANENQMPSIGFLKRVTRDGETKTIMKRFSGKTAREAADIVVTASLQRHPRRGSMNYNAEDPKKVYHAAELLYKNFENVALNEVKNKTEGLIQQRDYEQAANLLKATIIESFPHSKTSVSQYFELGKRIIEHMRAEITSSKGFDKAISIAEDFKYALNSYDMRNAEDAWKKEATRLYDGLWGQRREMRRNEQQRESEERSRAWNDIFGQNGLEGLFGNMSMDDLFGNLFSDLFGGGQAGQSRSQQWKTEVATPTHLELYQVLDVKRTSDPNEIKAAFRKLVFQLHPDRNPNPTAQEKGKLQEIMIAYAVLSDPEKRKVYDRTGKYTV